MCSFGWAGVAEAMGARPRGEMDLVATCGSVAVPLECCNRHVVLWRLIEDTLCLAESNSTSRVMFPAADATENEGIEMISCFVRPFLL